MSEQFLPLVSIVIPVYNGSNYMREAIDSAIAQTYPNIEIIVVNDGSRDDGKTSSIAREYGSQIRYFEKENGGCASALNLALANMQGQYFSWLSHDDVYYSNKIEHQINILSLLPNQDTIIYGGYELIDENSKSLYFVKIESQIPINKRNISLAPLFHGLFHGCSLLIPTRYFQEIGGFDERLLCTQDYALWFKFLRAAPIHFDADILIKSRIHKNQSTHRIPSRIEECNELWISFLQELTEQEMIDIDGSVPSFLLRQTKFLSGGSYNQAADLAAAMANKALNSTKISVVMPVYNRIQYAIEAIKTVLAQTHTNFELIVVDDGSDEDVSLLIEQCKEDKRIIYFRRENSGSAASRNFGVKIASGQYIAFLDADDLFSPRKLELQLRFMEDEKLTFSHTSYERINLAGENLGIVHSANSNNMFPKIIASCTIATPTVMVKTSLLRINPFPEQINIGEEDVCLWISIARTNIIGALDQALSKIRVSETSAAFDRKKRMIGLINIAAFVVNHKYITAVEEEICQLLSRAIGGSKIAKLKKDNSRISLIPYIPTLLLRNISRVFQSIRDDGVRRTWNKIYIRLKMWL